MENTMITTAVAGVVAKGSLTRDRAARKKLNFPIRFRESAFSITKARSASTVSNIFLSSSTIRRQRIPEPIYRIHWGI